MNKINISIKRETYDRLNQIRMGSSTSDDALSALLSFWEENKKGFVLKQGKKGCVTVVGGKNEYTEEETETGAVII